MNLFLDTADYRDLLKSYYERRKKERPLYSYRMMMGEKLGLDSSFLFRVLQKKHHLPVHALQKTKEMLASGKLSLMDARLTVGGPEKALAVRNFRKQTLNLAIEALDNVLVNERNVSPTRPKKSRFSKVSG